MKATNLLFLILISLMLGGCQSSSKEDSTGPYHTDPCKTSSSNYWYPFSVGDEWKWNMNTSGLFDGSFRVRVTKGPVVNGRAYVSSEFDDASVLSAFNDFCWIYGYVTASGDLREYDPETGYDGLYLSYRPFVGQQWIRQGQQWKVVSINASLKTPFCSYTGLLKTEIDNQDYAYYAKGVGLVAVQDKASGEISYWLEDVKIKL